MGQPTAAETSARGAGRQIEAMRGIWHSDTRGTGGRAEKVEGRWMARSYRVDSREAVSNFIAVISFFNYNRHVGEGDLVCQRLSALFSPKLDTVSYLLVESSASALRREGTARAG